MRDPTSSRGGEFAQPRKILFEGLYLILSHKSDRNLGPDSDAKFWSFEKSFEKSFENFLNKTTVHTACSAIGYSAKSDIVPTLTHM